MFSDKTINIHYRAPTSKLLKMNTFNEFELNRMKKLYNDQLLASRLQRSKSSRLPAGNHRNKHQTANNAFSRPIGSFGVVADPIRQYHNPNIIGRTPYVDLNRYQRAFLTASTNNHSSMNYKQQQNYARFGRALFNFQAKNERELSLERGDLVELLEVTRDRSWVKVEDCQSGLQGLVPLSYIDYSVGCAVAKRDVNTGAGSTGSCCSIRVGNSIEKAPILPMSKGEPITLIRRLTGQQCYEASNTRQALGVVWSSDLEIIKQPVLTDKDLVERANVEHEFLFKHRGGEEEGAEEDDYGEDDDEEEEEEEEEEMIILDSGERVLTRRRRRPRAHSASSGARRRNGCCVGGGGCSISEQSMTKQQACCCSLAAQGSQPAPRRSSSSPYISANCQQTSVEPHELNYNQAEHNAQLHFGRRQESEQTGGNLLPRLCRAKYAYKARQKDELDLVVGEVLMVVHECDDGWFIGCRWAPNSRPQAARELGTFPGNFVESI